MQYASSSSDDNEVRFCSGCEKEVYQCATDEELTHNIQLNRCVAINRSGIYDTRGLPMTNPSNTQMVYILASLITFLIADYFYPLI